MTYEEAFKISRKYVNTMAESYVTNLAYGCKKDPEYEEMLEALTIASQVLGELVSNIKGFEDLFKNNKENDI